MKGSVKLGLALLICAIIWIAILNPAILIGTLIVIVMMSSCILICTNALGFLIIFDDIFDIKTHWKWILFTIPASVQWIIKQSDKHL